MTTEAVAVPENGMSFGEWGRGVHHSTIKWDSTESLSDPAERYGICFIQRLIRCLCVNTGRTPLRADIGHLTTCAVCHATKVLSLSAPFLVHILQPWDSKPFLLLFSWFSGFLLLLEAGTPSALLRHQVVLGCRPPLPGLFPVLPNPVDYNLLVSLGQVCAFREKSFAFLYPCGAWICALS